MGYLFIVLALSTGAVKGFCGKKTSGYMQKQRDAMLISFVRMSLCALFGAIMLLIGENVSAFKADISTLLIALLSGVANSIFVVTWLMAIRKGAYMMVDIFLTLGTMVAIGMSSLFFSETILPRQIIGLAGLLCAVVLMCSYNNSLKEKLNFSALCVLIFCGTASGIADFSQKLFVKTCSDVSVSTFNFYTYLFSAMILLVICALSGTKKEPSEKGSSLGIVKKISIYLIIMAICLYLNSYFKTEAAKLFDASQLYSMILGFSMIISATMSAVLFKEKITFKAICGMVLAFLSLLLINLKF